MGPGLLESIYEECLAHELRLAGLRFERQKAVPVFYKNLRLPLGHRLDFLVEGELVVEVKAVERVLRVHEAQLLTYLKLTNVRAGLLVNFHTASIKDCLRRLTLKS
jgi:GxxExxY protein